MRIFLLIFSISIILTSAASAQMIGRSLLLHEGETFLVLNSQFEENSIFSDETFRGSFSVVSGVIVLDSIISGDLGDIEIGQNFKFTGNLTVSVIESNKKQISKLLSKGGVSVDEYSSELKLFSFEEGRLSNEFCVGKIDKFCAESTGQLVINFWGVSGSLKLIHEGNIICDFTNEEIWEDKLYVLPVGTYQIQEVTLDGQIVLTEFQIQTEQRYYYYDKTDEYSYAEYYNYGTDLTTTDYLGFDFLYSNSNLFSLSNNEGNKSYHIGVNGGFDLFNDKLGLTEFCITYGFAYEYIGLDNEVDSLGMKEVKRTSYSGLYYSTDLFLRQYFSMPLANRNTRPCIDFGVSYRLPLYFRKNIAVQGYRFSEKWLHMYNELVAFTRIGISNGVALNVSYRPFNSIKNGLPELPKLQFGLTIQVDVY